MSDNQDTADRSTRHENFAAELTSAAYPLLLRRGLKGSWVKMELALWKALAETVERWTLERRCAAYSSEFDARQEGFLADLTGRALSVAAENEVEGPLPDLERGVDLAFRSLLRCRGQG